MADTKDTNTNPTLFDAVEPQEPTTGQGTAAPQEPAADVDEWADVLRVYGELKEQARQAGVWCLFAPETLIQSGEVLYNQHKPQIITTMRKNGASVDTIATVLSDYIGVITGVTTNFEATPEQMQEALRALPPFEAFYIDRYALYFGLLMNYSRYLLRFGEYTEKVKGVVATEETKRQYIEAFYSTMDARAIKWLSHIGYIKPADFGGIEPAKMSQFFARITAYAALGEYALYYTVARLALTATPQELATVEPPPVMSQTTVQEFCEVVLKDTAEQLNKAAEKFAAAGWADTQQEQAQAREAGENWHADTNTPTVKIHENFVAVLSKPVNVSSNGADIIKELSVQRYIDEFNKNPLHVGNITDYGTVTVQAVQRAFEGVNLLNQYLSGQTPYNDDRIIFHTNLSEFSKICGYADAGQAEQRALLGALLIIRNLYFIIDKPVKIIEYKDSRGRTRRRKTGGKTAVQFINVPTIGLENGELHIELYRDCLKGEPVYVHGATFKQLRGKVKSTPQSRFNYQLATKSHKSERDMIDEVFGFRDMLNNAATDEERKRVKTYVQNHRPECRKKILRWVDDYMKDGILTKFSRTPSKTDARDFVLSWELPKPEKLNPPPSNPDDDTAE